MQLLFKVDRLEPSPEPLIPFLNQKGRGGSEGANNKVTEVGEDACPAPSQGDDPKVDLPRLGIVQVFRQVDLSTEAISFSSWKTPPW